MKYVKYYTFMYGEKFGNKIEISQLHLLSIDQFIVDQITFYVKKNMILETDCNFLNKYCHPSANIIAD